MSKRGELIVFEGADGTGKTTQAKLATQHLKDKGLSVLHGYVRVILESRFPELDW